MADQTIEQQLKAPFDEKDYEWRVQSETKKGDKVLVLCYVTARAVQDRLDAVFGVLGWQVNYSAGADGGVLAQISAWDKENSQWVTKSDGAANTEIEAVKGGISSAFKRAGSVWGIGRLLYGLQATYVPLLSNGDHFHKAKDKTYKYWNPPPLPDWAVATRLQKKANKKPPPQPQPQPITEAGEVNSMIKSLVAEFGKEKCRIYCDTAFGKGKFPVTIDQCDMMRKGISPTALTNPEVTQDVP